MNAKEILEAAWPLREGPAVFTTVSGVGRPNSVYVLSMRLLADGRIAIMDNYFNKTRENINGGSSGAFLFLSRPRKQYQAKGPLEYLTSGPVYEELKAAVDTKHPRVGVVVLTVEELYSGAERLA